METSLSIVERSELKALEEIIEKGKQTFVDVGRALMLIRDKRLYRVDYKTFDNYCKERWKFTRRYADNLISGSKVVNLLIENHGSQISIIERQVRPLTHLPPEQQKKVWQKAVETAPEGKVTAKYVEKTIKELFKWVGPKNKKVAPPSNGLQFARMAILDLEQIRDDDIERIKAFDMVKQWIKDHE